MDYSQTYSTTTLYQSFCEIDRMSYNTIIRFFDEHQEDITDMGFEEYFDILTTYVHALYEAGAYQKHAAMADVVIEASIINNVQVLRGLDIYEKTLFQKASSLYHLHAYASSAHILTELVKMNPNHTDYRDFLIKNRFQIKPAYLRSAQGTAIACYFLCIFIIAIASFYIDPFQPAWSPMAEMARNLAFISGTGILLCSDGIHRLRIIYKTMRLVRESKEKMKRS